MSPGDIITVAEIGMLFHPMPEQILAYDLQGRRINSGKLNATTAAYAHVIAMALIAEETYG